MMEFVRWLIFIRTVSKFVISKKRLKNNVMKTIIINKIEKIDKDNDN